MTCNRSGARCALAAAVMAAAIGCEGGGSGPADVAPAAANLQPTVAFEGQPRLAVELSGVDFSGVSGPPTIRGTRADGVPDPMPDGAIEVTDWACNAVRCGVAMRVGKWRDSTGQAVPTSIYGEQIEIRFAMPERDITATLLVLPLDAGGAGTAASPPSALGTAMYSSLDLRDDVRMAARAGTDARPVRIFVTGDVTLGTGASIDASGGSGSASVGGAAGPGGGNGAAIGYDAERTTGGRAGTGTAGGGGGGFGEPGAACSTSAGGTDCAGGAVGESTPIDCLRANTANCGGGGGGSSATGDGGGGGGGGLLVATLGTFRTAANTVRSNGGNGFGGTDSGGGAGAGGAVAIAASRLEGTLAIEALGGAGGTGGSGAGGAGGRGRVRADFTGPGSVTANAATSWRGPVVDLEGLDQVVSTDTVTLSGTGEPGATVILRNGATRPATTAEGAVTEDGTFSIAIALLPGLNEIEVAQRSGSPAIEARGLTGTAFEMAGQVVTGARIVVVRVPEVE